MKDANAALQKKRPEGKEAFFAELEKQGRELIKDFPDKQEPYQMLIAVAQQSEPEKARAILKEINTDKAPESVKKSAAGTLAQLDAVGKPLDDQVHGDRWACGRSQLDERQSRPRRFLGDVVRASVSRNFPM
jgi:hypothetical protein